jgi:uncharacterized protein (DUF362 family)
MIPIDRRTFLRSLGVAGATLALNPHDLFGRTLSLNAPYFGVHPFIEEHPDAVFVLSTNIDTKLNSSAKKQVGLAFGSSVFVPMTTAGTPTTANVAVKPNLTCRSRTHPAYTIERSMGIVTDVYFVEGVLESLMGLGLSGSQFSLREVNCPGDFADGGYMEMAARTGADIRYLSGSVSSLPPEFIQWVDVPDGVWFSRIPYLWPVNAPGAFLLNIAKLKTHSMGLTLTAKNLQGSIARGYVAHCTQYGTPMSVSPNHVKPDANAVILSNYNRHLAEGIPRWDRPGSTGGIWQETWATRCLDNNSVTKPALHIIEGIYGRDGDFMDGPSPEGLATDYMTNLIIFGKNPFHVDIVGHWIGGHEPGNFGLFHMAIERGMSSFLDPMAIPVYEWSTSGAAVTTTLTNFQRTSLKTKYLQRDYNGQTEPLWHLVNEPYQYPTSVGIALESRPDRFVLAQNFPNPFNGETSVQFSLPHEGNVRIEVFDMFGQVVEVLKDGLVPGGAHMVHWNGSNSASGVYFCRMLFGGMSQVKPMVLLR